MANDSTDAKLSGSTEESLILTLLDLANHLTRNGGRIARDEGLTAQQWLLLLQIAGDPNFPKLGETSESGAPVLASNIATARGVSRPTISALVSSLVEKGLVSQAEDPGDRRQKTLEATAAGLDALRRIEPARRRANKALLADFEPEEISLVLRVLRACLDTLWSERQRNWTGNGVDPSGSRSGTIERQNRKQKSKGE